ncbi:putative ribosomally synthesized peptide with nif11-like leader [Ancylobacter aquaticus]|uniref:Putative ribosomally synthesized peptide with nif11-like leader n=1 Tax=Ancylobacter aquaticus TaxID=100 RepID=A0A4R1I0P9_ANCAQ|nr:Nif11-like leader peptide family RiPP precursor [Ancylobacter aquaticus]TCK23482.1 putative ribosomally synthesized peptide with nif11-like leader [Ancylobacter aquaticus]
MSMSEIQRFGADLQSDAALRAEAETVGTQATSPDDVTAFAAARGYDFTADELAEVASEARSKLSDAELDGISGGADGNGYLVSFAAAMLLWAFIPKDPALYPK